MIGGHVVELEIFELLIFLCRKIVRKKDRFWIHAEELSGKFKCKYCSKVYSGGVARLKSHLSQVSGRDIETCDKVPPNVQTEAFIAICGDPSKRAKSTGSTNVNESGESIAVSGSRSFGGTNQMTMHEVYKKKNKEEVDQSLAKFFIMNNISFNVVQSESFIDLIKDVANYGSGYKVPSYSTLRTKLIPNEKKEAETYVGKVKSSWYLSGCTIMSDGWTDLKGKAFTNVIAYSPGAGDMLLGKYPRMYKTRCAAHGLQLLLKDIYKNAEWVRIVIDEARLIENHMYKHTVLLALMREATQKELKHPCITRFASNFLVLQSLVDVENELRLFVASAEWRESNLNKNRQAKKVTELVQNNEFWNRAKEVLQALEPIVRVLRLVDGEGSTSGYLYDAMERAKEAIKCRLGNNQNKFMRIWELFDERRNGNIIHPIHAAAALLNPAYMCRERFRESREMKDGIGFMFENLILPEEKEDFLKQVQLYRSRSTLIFNSTALMMLKTSHPRVWWDYCGDPLPVLRKYAVRILSQPCSSSSCERNWSAYEAAQTKKRNRLSSEMLDNLVYTRMNILAMKKWSTLESQDLEPINLEKLHELSEYIDDGKGGDGDDGEEIEETSLTNLDLLWLNQELEFADYNY
ncbi:uncharacterized protein LOC109728860 isoform X2 [Ananas comosus]|uniref:Uncharacterized protein LOC109728860 isoform X2 n=1 Tax=Ananas comosus TaxID=4615 RepID=A0A6P5H205_ANACO|nr:uncharacterized protein LOC109728860 isoform X2 [Ananas comosus]